MTTCNLINQGYQQGNCQVSDDKSSESACHNTLRKNNQILERLITAAHLSRPENYLSIYQSGCNMGCRKCHSWKFSKVKAGKWYSPKMIVQQTIEYEKTVTLVEPREKSTAWHAHDTCRCCGYCTSGAGRAKNCPGILEPDQITLSPQGWGPVRNIVAFTGGDIMCQPEFYGQSAALIKQQTTLHILLESNGYGLTNRNLDYFEDHGVDVFWLDIKAYNDDHHIWLTGVSNRHILTLPEEMKKRGFIIEVLSLFIPDLVDAAELQKIALHLSQIDKHIPFTILAFFPQYLMASFQPPTVFDMVEAYEKVRAVGLVNVRLGNLGVFLHTQTDFDYYNKHVGNDG